MDTQFIIINFNVVNKRKILAVDFKYKFSFSKKSKENILKNLLAVKINAWFVKKSLQKY